MVDERYVEGAAYHEAAHIVVAAVQGLLLGKKGLRIDQNGAGLACYRCKQPDRSVKVGPDPWREHTIIATLAGQIAHGIFYEPVANGDANAYDDLDHVRKLVSEMYPVRDDQFKARAELLKRSKALVHRHWEAVDGLAKALWAKPWSHDPPHEKRIEGKEVISLLGQYKISAALDES